MAEPARFLHKGAAPEPPRHGADDAHHRNARACSGNVEDDGMVDCGTEDDGVVEGGVFAENCSGAVEWQHHEEQQRREQDGAVEGRAVGSAVEWQHQEQQRREQDGAVEGRAFGSAVEWQHHEEQQQREQDGAVEVVRLVVLLNGNIRSSSGGNRMVQLKVVRLVVLLNGNIRSRSITTRTTHLHLFHLLRRIILAGSTSLLLHILIRLLTAFL